jgi:uncharacterized protein
MSARPSAHVDARSPFVLDTRELGRRAGSMLELRRELPAPPDWELELVKVPVGAAVSLELRLESVVDGVLVSTDLRAPLEAECGRCLEPITDVLELSVAELFVYEPDPDDDEVPVLDGDLADLAPVLRDAVVLALPLNPVCDETCAGLCPTCGARLDDVEPDHTHDTADPRWAALSRLTTTTDGKSVTMDPAEDDSATTHEADAHQRAARSIREK